MNTPGQLFSHISRYYPSLKIATAAAPRTSNNNSLKSRPTDSQTYPVWWLVSVQSERRSLPEHNRAHRVRTAAETFMMSRSESHFLLCALFDCVSPFPFLFFFKRHFQPLPLPLFKHTGWQSHTEPFSLLPLKKTLTLHLIKIHPPARRLRLPHQHMVGRVNANTSLIWRAEAVVVSGCNDLITSILRESFHSGRRGHGTWRLLTNNP